MRVEIQHRCSAKYTALLRLYCCMTAFTALCASVAFGCWRIEMLSFASGAVCAFFCCAAVAVPMGFGRVSYLRSGGCLRIEKGLLTKRILIINRGDIRGSEIRRGFVQRKIGLCTLTFFTGSGKVRLRGIELADGRMLDRMLCSEGVRI